MVSHAETAKAGESFPVSVVSRLLRQRLVATRSPRFCVATTLVLATIVALGLSVLCGIPAPRVHDEFSYLLGADTFVNGRWTNPTHPFWQHFETFHVIHQPSYASKYPPAQSLSLAVGQLLGHPIIGACLVTGASLAGVVWMLIGWLPRRLHWLIVVYASLHPLFQIVWGQSYWGGGLQLLGASLLLGAYIRFNNQLHLRYALIAAMGVLLLANSRPWEGAVLTLSVAVAIGWRWIAKSEWQPFRFLVRMIVPAALLLSAGGGLMLGYNSAVTGHPLKMPYMVHEQTYGWNPVFLWGKAGEKPHYRHPVMERFFEQDKQKAEAKFDTLGNTLRIKSHVAYQMFNFLCGATAVMSLLGLPRALRRSRYRVALALVTPVFLASLVTPWAWPHYVAPAAPLLITLMFAGLYEIWLAARPAPLLRWALLAVVVFSHANWWTSTLKTCADSRQSSWARQRLMIEQMLLASEGRDLVFVRYQDKHVLNAEWVYNAANIDDAAIVWAREISAAARQELMEYFHERQVWIVDADATPPTLTRFAPAADNYHPRIKLVNE